MCSRSVRSHQPGELDGEEHSRSGRFVAKLVADAAQDGSVRESGAAEELDGVRRVGLGDEALVGMDLDEEAGGNG